METIEIRPARPADAAEVLALQHAAYRIEGARYDDFTLPPLVETVADLTAALRSHIVLVARRSSGVAAAPTDPIVGTVRGQVVDGTAHIGRLAVHPDLHGQGIGRQLLRAIESRLAPVERYELFTGHRSDRNLRMYERAGYRRVAVARQTDRVRLVYLEKVGTPAGGVW